MSLMEALANNAIAFVISIVANQLVLPLFGLTVSLAQSIIVRGYVVRRIFEGWGH
jgi:hypothetical protein